MGEPFPPQRVNEKAAAVAAQKDKIPSPTEGTFLGTGLETAN